ncbi:V-type proton ATPase subunit S1 [Epargyreus clarus]|uniref:V-type proton ATPase subunit S1 n=1 Tax=Epargyreus clarus TaxID=520877 RepID=UPI003C2DF0D2
MAFSRSVFVLLVLNVVVSFATVPVFIWGDLEGKAPKSNPLWTVTELEFEGIMKRELQDNPFVAVIVDESLSVEDFSLKTDGATVFPYLHANIGKAVYLPAVESPLDTLHRIADPKKTSFIQVTDEEFSAELDTQDDGTVFITLKDAQVGETRADLLRRHSDFMEDMFSKLQQKYDKVVAVYTARYPSWTVPSHRARRQAEASTNTTDYMLNGLRLYVNQTILTIKGQVTNLTSLVSSQTTFGENYMTTEMNFGDQILTLNFTQNRGYWSFDSVAVHVDSTSFSEVLYGTSEVYALMGFSYRCGHNVTFSGINDTDHTTLQFKDMKVQPFFKETNATENFGESFNCVGFFSVPIWSGLFVTFVLLAITFYGIMMMMDIRTMDRFDDPKGKTITINAGE